jgi:hypothetical protein
MSTFRPDLVIKSPEGSAIAAIEVENLQGLSSSEATEMRSSLLKQGLPAQIPYFLLLSQEVGFLWKKSPQDSPDAPPAYKFPMDKVISRYSVREAGQWLYGTELEDVVLEWLMYLSLEWLEVAEEPEKTLALSGFNDVIKGAEVLIEEEL